MDGSWTDTPSHATLPIVDMSGLSGDARDRAAVARDIRAACLESGFFYLAGHGIPMDEVARVFALSRDFFALPLAEKTEISLARSRCNRGYEPLRAQVLEAGTPPDVKEGFYLGPDLAPDDPRVVAGLFNHGPNQWPAGLPEFRATMTAYLDRMTALACRVMEGIALSLDLTEDYFAAFSRDPVAILRLLHYPPQPANPLPDEKGCGTHTDWGFLTLLLQDDSGGLEVRTPAGWIAAPPIPGTFVVNIGDMVARWTNDLYRSTPHRVINRSGRDRMSVPFFFEGNPTHPIVCLPGCSGPDNPPRYAPITVQEHLADMYRRTYGA